MEEQNCNDVVYVGIKIPRKIKEGAEKEKDAQGFSSLSEYLRFLIREDQRKIQRPSPKKMGKADIQTR